MGVSKRREEGERRGRGGGRKRGNEPTEGERER